MNEAKNETVGTGTNLVSYGKAVKALKEGRMIQRVGWNGKGMFVFRQVPSLVPVAIIPKMSSLPESVKEKMIKRNKPIEYSNQLALVKPDNSVN